MAAAQSQKHVTHNDALLTLDAVVQLSVLNTNLATPPGSPVEGQRHIIGSAATGAWAGKDLNVTYYSSGIWVFLPPRKGWSCWNEALNELLVWNGSAWANVVQASGAVTATSINNNSLPARLTILGLGGATANATNRLSINAPAALFNNAGSSITITANKNAAANDAAITFQTAFSSRALVGLLGTDDFSIKVSPDGSTWKTALEVNRTTGAVTLPNTAGTGGAVLFSAAQSLTYGEKLQACSNISAASLANTSIQTFAAAVGVSIPAGGIFFQCDAAGSSESYPFLFRRNGVVRWYWAVDAANALRFYAYNSSGSYVSEPLRLAEAGAVSPGADNSSTLGTSSLRWSTVYAATGTINTSDIREKKDIAKSMLGLDFINALVPVSYKWRVGSNSVVRTQEGHEQVILKEAYKDEVSGIEYPAIIENRPKFKETIVSKPGTRTHYGLIAQDVKAALKSVGISDFAGYIKENPSDPDSREGLRYDQFIPALIKAVQELDAKVKAL